MPDTPPSDHFPRPFGDYLLLAEIGAGGMGIVYQAVHTASGRPCALKLIRPASLPSAESAGRQVSAEQRFATEIEAASALDHEGIVRVLHSGVHEGQRFLAMELIEGGTLADRLASGPLAPREAAALLARLVRAVQFAHARGVLHRDLKPGNVLLDDQGQPRLADFGIARLLNRESDLTRTLAYLGTPAYLAPELASGKAGEATTAADTYSLGVILYECLAGRPPFQADNVAALLQKVAHETPPPVTTAATQHGATKEPIPSDLVVLIERAMAREPDRRFASAAEFADELERFLNGEPIQSRPVPLGERLWLLCRRRPGTAAAIGSVAFLAALAVVSIVFLWLRAAEVSSELRRTVARDTMRLIDLDFSAGEVPRAYGTAAETMLRMERSPTFAWLKKRLAEDRWFVQTRSLSFAGEVMPRFDLPRQRIVSAGVGGCWLHDLNSGEELLHLPTLIRPGRDEMDQTAAAWVSADGARLFVEETDGRRGLWDIQDLSRPSLLWSNFTDCRFAVAPDGRSVVVAEAGGSTWLAPLDRTNSLAAWPTDATATLPPGAYSLPPTPAAITRLAISSNATVIVAGLADGRVCALEPASLAWRELATGLTNLAALAVTLDGGVALTAVGANIAGWRLANGAQSFAVPNSAPVAHLIASPDREWFAVSSKDHTVCLRRVTDGASEGKPWELGRATYPPSIAFTPSGRHLLASVVTGKTLLIRVEPQELVATAYQWQFTVDPTFDEERSLLLTGSDEGKVRFWHLGSPPPPSTVSTTLVTGFRASQRVPVPTGAAEGWAIGGDRRPALLAICGDGGLVAISPGTNCCDVRSFGTFPSVATAAFSITPQPATFLADTNGGLSRVWIGQTNPPVSLLQFASPIYSLAAAADGRHLLLAVATNLVAVSVSGDAARVTSETPFPDIVNFAFSPSGKYGAAMVRGGTLVVLDAESGRVLWSAADHIQGTFRDFGMTFSPDGQRLATASPDGTVRIWDSASGRQLIPPFIKLADPVSVAWDSQGRRLVVGGADTAALIDARTGAQIARFGPVNRYTAVAFSPDDQQVAIGDSTGEISLWSVEAHCRLATWKMAPNPNWKGVLAPAWTGVPGELVFSSRYGVAGFIHQAPSVEPALLRILVEYVTGRTVNADGATLELTPTTRAEHLARLRVAAASGDLAPAYARHLPPP